MQKVSLQEIISYVHCHYLFCYVTFEEEGVRYGALFEEEMGFKTMKNLVMLSIYGPLPLVVFFLLRHRCAYFKVRWWVLLLTRRGQTRQSESLRRDLTGGRRIHREEQQSRERMQTSRSHLALGVTSLRSSQQSLNDAGDMNNYMLGGGDLYYNSRPQHNTGMSVSHTTLFYSLLFAFYLTFVSKSS